MAGKFGGRKVISVHEQRAALAGLCPTFRASIKDGTLIAVGDLQPIARSDSYRVRVEYHVGESPKIYVVSPELVPREKDGKIPHTYRGNRPCVFLPGSGEWAEDMWLARTIVPWVSEWLFYYELWHAMGEWLGGGVEPQEEEPIRNNRSPEYYDRPTSHSVSDSKSRWRRH